MPWGKAPGLRGDLSLASLFDSGRGGRRRPRACPTL